MSRPLRTLVACVLLTVAAPVARVSAASNDIRPARGPAKVAYAKVVLDEQRAYFYNSSRRLIVTLPVSTGTDDQTPVGVFRVFSKSALAIYSPAPNERMRYMVRFTKGREGDNIGFHGIPFKVTKSGEIPFYTPLGVAPSSHGCIRMLESDAKWAFDNMAIGTRVTVVQSRA